MQCHIREKLIPEFLLIRTETVQESGKLAGLSVHGDKKLGRHRSDATPHLVFRARLVGREADVFDLHSLVGLLRQDLAELIALEKLFVAIYAKQDLRLFMCENTVELWHLEAVHEQHALTHENVEDIAAASVQRLIIGLSLGDHHICIHDGLARFP